MSCKYVNDLSHGDGYEQGKKAGLKEMWDKMKCNPMTAIMTSWGSQIYKCGQTTCTFETCKILKKELNHAEI